VTLEQFDDVLGELRKMSRLLTLLVTKDMSQKEKIERLSSAGLQPKEIAELIGTTPNTVSVRLAEIRKHQAAHRAGGAPKGGAAS